MPGLNQTASNDQRNCQVGKTSSCGSTPFSIQDGPSTYEYPAATFPGYAEKPLYEQLEPLAVVGMGTYITTTAHVALRLSRILIADLP